jgi:two-component system, LytTR family, response regulator
MIKVVLIDDEENCLSALEILLTEYCPDVQIMDRCKSVKAGLSAISKHQPDLIFLDIEMPVLNGFDLLEQIKNHALSVIFTTAYQHYAIKAIRYSALDYLLKPIDYKELIQAVHRFVSQQSRPNTEQFQFLIDKLSQKDHTTKKLAIPNLEGFKLVSIDDIILCEADDNYTHIILKNQIRITACRTLKEIQHLLEDYELFIRVHNSSLININEVNQYVRGEGGYVIMSNGSHVNVSRNKKETLLKYLLK